jgi:hypothetical protein
MTDAEKISEIEAKLDVVIKAVERLYASRDLIGLPLPPKRPEDFQNETQSPALRSWQVTS